jgi:hypothetical protein
MQMLTARRMIWAGTVTGKPTEVEMTRVSTYTAARPKTPPIMQRKADSRRNSVRMTPR